MIACSYRQWWRGVKAVIRISFLLFTWSHYFYKMKGNVMSWTWDTHEGEDTRRVMSSALKQRIQGLFQVLEFSCVVMYSYRQKLLWREELVGTVILLKRHFSNRVSLWRSHASYFCILGLFWSLCPLFGLWHDQVPSTRSRGMSNDEIFGLLNSNAPAHHSSTVPLHLQQICYSVNTTEAYRHHRPHNLSKYHA